MSKLIIIDEGNIKHKAIFAYSGQCKSLVKKICVEYGFDIEDSEEKEQAKKILEKRIKNRDIFVMQPTMMFMKMIIGYLKKIGIKNEDVILISEDFGSWRKEIDKNYKAQRKAFREGQESSEWWDKMYKDFNEFYPKLDESLNWYFIKEYKRESDDIASVAVRYMNGFDEKILISTDEDWQMLVSFPNVKVFSPYTKKYKIVKNPEAILAKKIKGDKSDNLLEAPKNEKEYEIRKKIVNLLELPQHIEQPIKEKLLNLPEKKIYLGKIPYTSCRNAIKDLYKID